MLGGGKDLTEKIWNSPAFAESKWFNKTCAPSVWQREVLEKATAAARELDMIRTTGGQHTAALTARYLETLDAADLSEYRRKLSEAASVTAPFESVQTGDVDQRTAAVTIRIHGTMDQLDYALDLLELAGVD